MPKAKRTAKQIAAATKNILRYEWKDDSSHILMGFVMGASVVFIAALLVIAL